MPKDWLIALLIAMTAGTPQSVENNLTKSNSTRPIEKVIYIPNGSLADRETVEANKELVRDYEPNGILINLKDDSGWILLEAKDGKAPYHIREYHPRFKAPYDRIISEFRTLGAHVFCRLVVFKDIKYPRSNSTGALKDTQTGDLWKNGLKEHWMDPWDWDYQRYLIKIAIAGKEAGCKQVLFDYVRFPSGGDGDTKGAVYPYFRGDVENRTKTIEDFLKSASSAVGRKNLSVAMFGVAFSNGREKAIGQDLVRFAPYINHAAPMLYPSHWDIDSLELDGDPNLYPYEVYKRAIARGLKHLEKNNMTMPVWPFIQVFDIRNIDCKKKEVVCVRKGKVISVVHYGRKEVKAQMQAAEEFEEYAGYYLWNPNGRYPKEIFTKKDGSK